MKNLVLLMAVVIFLSPLVVSASAGEIEAQKITETEDASMSMMVVNSSPMLAVQCGGTGTDAVLQGVGTFFVVLIIMGILLGAAA